MLPLVRTKTRNPAQRLRRTVDALPERTQRAMLAGLDRNRIIVGAYTDPRSGGICPMLAAHRNGGRTSLASFAVAWDAFTGARKPRPATRREIRTLRSYLEMALLQTDAQSSSVRHLAAQIRSERAARSVRADRAQPAPARPEAPVPLNGQIRIRRTTPGGRRARPPALARA